MEKEELPSSSKRKSETTRESKHVKGQIGKGEWVTHISLPIEFEKCQSDLIEGLISHLKSKFQQNKVSDVIVCDEFHMSVSRTLRIRKAQINELVSSLDSKLKTKLKFNCYFENVVVLKSGIFGGEDKRKFFLAFKINPNMEENLNQEYNLTKVVDDLNSCLKLLNLPEYYKNPTFHISFGYVKLDQDYADDVIRNLLNEIRNEINSFLSENEFNQDHMDKKCIKIERVKLKCGNNLNFFKLN